MMTIVGGSSLGLLNSSAGLWACAANGKIGEGPFINIVNGHLISQGRDDFVASFGRTDQTMTRTDGDSCTVAACDGSYSSP